MTKIYSQLHASLRFVRLFKCHRPRRSGPPGFLPVSRRASPPLWPINILLLPIFWQIYASYSVRSYCLIWFGHVEIMTVDRNPHNELHARFQGKTMADQYYEDLASIALTSRGANSEHWPWQKTEDNEGHPFVSRVPIGDAGDTFLLLS